MSIEKLFSLQGKRALVTGSSRGIGLAIAKLFGEAGAEVVYHGSRESEKLDAAVAAAKADNVKVQKVVADLGDPDAANKITQLVPDIDILVLNASVQRYMTVEQFDAAEFADEVKINVSVGIQLIQHYVEGMKERKFGRVITIGSINQLRPAGRLFAYAATKAAQNVVMLTGAKEYASYGITFNNISPGVIATDRNKAALADPKIVENLMQIVPAKRFGTAADVAPAALLLASDAGNYIDGSNIIVAGGMQL